jgi:hypothetical protein
MRALNYIVLVALAGSMLPVQANAKQSTVQTRRFELQTLLQPLYTIDFESTSAAFTLNRARLSASADAATALGSLETALEIDFSEKKAASMLKDASISLQLNTAVGFKVGQFKIPFGQESQQSATKLPTIWRSSLTQHLRDELAVAGRGKGAMVYGSPLEGLSYQLGVFDYAGHHAQSLEPQVLIEHAVVGVHYRFSKHLDFTYGLSVPQLSHELYTKEARNHRYLFHDLGIATQPCAWYEARAELFIGPDTADGKLFFGYLDNYQEIVSQGLTLTNTFSFALPHEQELMVTLQGEYLNGLGYQDYHYVDRSSYFVLGSGIKLLASKRFFIDISAQGLFDKNFALNQDGRVAIQLTSLSSFTHKKESP